MWASHWTHAFPGRWSITSYHSNAGLFFSLLFYTTISVFQRPAGLLFNTYCSVHTGFTVVGFIHPGLHSSLTFWWPMVGEHSGHSFSSLLSSFFLLLSWKIGVVLPFHVIISGQEDSSTKCSIPCTPPHFTVLEQTHRPSSELNRCHLYLSFLRGSGMWSSFPLLAISKTMAESRDYKA